MKWSLTQQQGITLIEILLTIGILALVGAALIQLGSTSLVVSDAGRRRAVATQLADGGLEAARTARDTNSVGFFDPTFAEAGASAKCRALINGKLEFDNGIINPCVASPTSPPTGGAGAEVVDGTFYRHLYISPHVTEDRADVTVYVFWNQEGAWASVANTSTLSRWR